jgi:hypothetical protein
MLADVIMIKYKTHAMTVCCKVAHGVAEYHDQLLTVGKSTFAKLVRLMWPQSRSMRLRLGKYGGNQNTLI